MSILGLFKSNEIRLIDKRKEFPDKYSFSFESKSPRRNIINDSFRGYK